MATSKQDTGVKYYKRLIQSYVDEYNHSSKKDSKTENEKNKVIECLNILEKEIDVLQDAIELHNFHLQLVDQGTKVPPNIIEASRMQVDRGEERLRELITKTNVEIDNFCRTGKKRVKNMEWWIPPAKIMYVGGLLVLAISTIVAVPVGLATAGVGLTVATVGAAVGGGLALVGGATVHACQTKANNAREQNARDYVYLTNTLTALEHSADTVKSNIRPMQPIDDRSTTTRNIRKSRPSS